MTEMVKYYNKSGVDHALEVHRGWTWDRHRRRLLPLPTVVVVGSDGRESPVWSDDQVGDMMVALENGSLS